MEEAETKERARETEDPSRYFRPLVTATLGAIIVVAGGILALVLGNDELYIGVGAAFLGLGFFLISVLDLCNEVWTEHGSAMKKALRYLNL